MGLQPGDTFGSYRVIGPLGRGGMATVYRCYEPALDRHVALKVLPGEFLHDATFSERFRREAKVIARLEHPNIVPIHAFGIEGNVPWMAMRLISGGSVSGLEKSRKALSASAMTILRGVAEALDYAHSKGVVHRDVKPQNILLDDAGRVYLADFGIAKMVEASGGLTQAGMISGTPQYMAPEQARGGTVDHRADIYALGVVAYELLTGRVPFAADTPVAILMKHISDPVPVPSPVDVPTSASHVLLKALAKNPDERWPSGKAFVDALEAALRASVTLANDVSAVRAAPEPTDAIAPMLTATALLDPTPRTTRASPPGGAASVAMPRVTEPIPRAPYSALVVGLALGTAVTALLVAGGLAYYVIKVRSPTDASGRAQSAPSEPTSPPPTQPSPPVATMPLQSPISSEAPQTLPPPPSTAAARARRSEPDAASSATPAPTTLPLAEAPATTAPASTPAPSSLAPRATVKEGRFERVVDFATGAPVSFEGRVGAIHASSVRFQAKDGRSSRFKKLFKRDSEPWVTLRAQFEVQRDKDAGDWHVVLGVDLLDDASNTVGTLTGSSTAEDDRQTLTLEEEFPQRVFQRVKTVRLRLDAAPD